MTSTPVNNIREFTFSGGHWNFLIYSNYLQDGGTLHFKVGEKKFLSQNFYEYPELSLYKENHNRIGILMPELELSFLHNAMSLKDNRLVKFIKIVAFFLFRNFLVILSPNTVLGAGGHHRGQITSNSRTASQW